METMKKEWGKPLTDVQRFVPQYCQTPCGDGKTYWSGTCDYTGYLFKDLNGNKEFDRNDDNWTLDEGGINAYYTTNTSEGHTCTMNTDPALGTMYFIFSRDQISYEWHGYAGGWEVKSGEEPMAKGYVARSREDGERHFIVFNTITPHNPS